MTPRTRSPRTGSTPPSKSLRATVMFCSRQSAGCDFKFLRESSSRQLVRAQPWVFYGTPRSAETFNHRSLHGPQGDMPPEVQCM